VKSKATVTSENIIRIISELEAVRHGSQCRMVGLGAVISIGSKIGAAVNRNQMHVGMRYIETLDSHADALYL
jgi:hypothetical protein